MVMVTGRGVVLPGGWIADFTGTRNKVNDWFSSPVRAKMLLTLRLMVQALFTSCGLKNSKRPPPSMSQPVLRKRSRRLPPTGKANPLRTKISKPRGPLQHPPTGPQQQGEVGYTSQGEA